jgi:tetratricopeptide (TPR) repeat protein
MHRPVTGSFALYPLVTASALWLVQPALAQPGRPAPVPGPAAAAVVWWTDYNSARKEATEKGLPLMVVVGTDNCFYCRKLEAGPLKDAGISNLLAGGFVALKLDATRAPEIAKALKVQMYPTTVLAAPDGKIPAFIEGYVEADRLGEQLKRTSTAVATADWAARDFNEASKALAASDYPRAVSLLRGVARDAGAQPVGVKAKQLLDEVERVAAGKIARAKQLEDRGQIQDAMDVLAEAVKQYAGTRAAADAATRLAGLAEKPEEVQNRRLRIARDLLAVARDDFRAGRLYDCIQKCEQISTAYGELPEAKNAVALLTDIKGNPERLAKACDQMNERTAAMYMALADSWARKGQAAEAAACLKKVVALCPNTHHADRAQSELVRLQGNTSPAVPAGLSRP